MEDLKKEEEARKKAIFDSMSPRRQQHIVKKGYEKWNPFLEPKDPLDLRRDKTNRTTQMLVREFLQTCLEKPAGNHYAQGVMEMALGIINEDDRVRGMFDFACWYRNLLDREKKGSPS